MSDLGFGRMVDDIKGVCTFRTGQTSVGHVSYLITISLLSLLGSLKGVRKMLQK